MLLFQPSLEFERLTESDNHSRFDEKLSTYTSNILNVKCTVRKENLLCKKPKYHLPEEKKKNPASLYIQSTICFKSQTFLVDLKLPS